MCIQFNIHLPFLFHKHISFREKNLFVTNMCVDVFVYVSDVLFPSPDGVLSYSMRQGDIRGSENSFYDFTYDGTRDPEVNYLRGGLGQLTDGEKGTFTWRQPLYSF